MTVLAGFAFAAIHTNLLDCYNSPDILLGNLQNLPYLPLPFRAGQEAGIKCEAVFKPLDHGMDSSLQFHV